MLATIDGPDAHLRSAAPTRLTDAKSWDAMPEPHNSDEPASAGLSNRKQVGILAVAALLAAVVIAGARLGSATLGNHAAKLEAPARIEAGSYSPTPAQWAALRVAPVGTMAFQTERVTDGKIALNGDRTTPVFSPYSGRVTRVLANVGDRVHEGQALLAIEASEFVQGQNDLIAAANAVNTARSQLGLAQGNERRKQALFEAKGGSLQDWQQSQAELAASENTLRSAEATLASVRNRLRILGRTDAEIAALQASARIDPITFVTAPIAGTVTDRQVGAGQYVQAGAANPVYTISDLSTVWLVGNVREADAPLMRRGLDAEVRVLALPDRSFKARLTNVAPAMDANTRRLAVRAEVNNAEGLLKPEMFATFAIVTGESSSSPAVPEGAIVYEGDSARVWVQQGDTLAARPIRVGRKSAGMVEVLAGLKPGDRLVTSGALFIDRAGRGD